MVVDPPPQYSRRPDAHHDSESEKGSVKREGTEDKARLKKETKIRRNAIVILSFLYLLAIIFLVLVEVGNTKGDAVLGSMYFFKLDLTDVLVSSAPSSATLQNSIARSLGLHDFYQVGLWNFCEGYSPEGITHCTKPSPWFWFNPVAVLLDELLAGATIVLPGEVNQILNILRIASHIMFGFFLGGLVLNIILLIISPAVLYSKWWSLPLGILSFISAIIVIVGASLATAISFIFQAALNTQPDLGISASVGGKMLVFQWTAAGLSLLCFIFHAGMGCCCTSRRDIQTGRKQGRYQQVATGPARHESQEYQSQVYRPEDRTAPSA